MNQKFYEWLMLINFERKLDPLMKILFLVPYPLKSAPSQRFRFEQYLHFQKNHKIIINVKSFLSPFMWPKFYLPKQNLWKIGGIIWGFLKRFFISFTIHHYDFVFIHREATPIGPPIFEWFIAKVLRKKIIYDYDDAIWLEDPQEKGTILGKIKWKSKVAQICRWSYKISIGNEYLASYAYQFNDNVVLNPTTIDTEGLHNPLLYKKVEQKKITIGWTGTHSTLPYLQEIIPVLQKLESKFDFTFLVIANKNPDFELKSMVFCQWKQETEIQDLMKIDIGIMPLTDDNWSKGKCGFKALQYMSLGIPTCASPIGVNSKIIKDGENGYLCDSTKEWLDKLTILLSDSMCRKRLGDSGQQTVFSKFSVESNQSNFLKLFS